MPVIDVNLTEGFFDGVEPDTFGYFLAVNCYQHAIGRHTPIISRMVQGDQMMLGFVSLTPGCYNRGGSKIQTRIYEEFVVRGCLTDKAIDLGKTISFKEGYKTAALYIGNRRNDFHCVTVNEDGSGESKLPTRHVKKADDYRKLSNDYRFSRFLQLREGELPESMICLNPQPFRFQPEGGVAMEWLAVGHKSNLVYGDFINVTKRTLISMVSAADKLVVAMPIPERFHPILNAIEKIPAQEYRVA